MAAIADGTGFDRDFPNTSSEDSRPGHGNPAERNRTAIGGARPGSKHWPAGQMVSLILVATRLALSATASHTRRRGAKGLRAQRRQRTERK